MPPPGRRPGNVDTRAEILAAARGQFAEVGYAGASLRGIARAAGVDAALVHHYFDGKDGLFAEAMQLPFNPWRTLPTVLDGPVDSLGERVARFFLDLWESPETGPQMVAFLRSSLGTEEGTRRVREFILHAVLAQVITRLTATDAALRASLVMTQLVGVAIGRYVMRAPALAQANVDELARVVGVTLQRYFTGHLLPTEASLG